MLSDATGSELDSVARQGISRRKFLGLCPVAVASVATIGQTSTAVVDDKSKQLAREHGNDPALLIDLTKCVGCGMCVSACKKDNDLESRADQPALGPEAVLASSNWTVVEGRNVAGEVSPVKRQCMHCLEPACASVCFVKALEKTEAGPVSYDPNKCVGCRFCLMACPFGIPTFDWDATLGQVSKCDMCADRTSQGLPTACAEACPSGALTFGRRDGLLSEAHSRMTVEPGKYVDHVYGESEVGGTSVLYISDVPFDKLGFASLGTEPLPEYTWRITRWIPPVAMGLGAALVTLYARRMKVLEEKEEEEERETLGAGREEL